MGVSNNLVEKNKSAARGGTGYGRRTFFFFNSEGHMRGAAGGVMCKRAPTAHGHRGDSRQSDQGTVRIDRNFNGGSNAFFRYSAQGEHGFMPENLPGFGYFHDNLSQQGVLGSSQVLSRSLLNTATLAISRLSMDHTTQSANTN